MGMVRDIKTLPYVTYQMSGEELLISGSRSIAEGLSGKLPGIRTYRDIDGIVKISSLRPGYKRPLYVIDGIPTEEDPSLWLNLMDIESITALVTANLASLYGSAGVGGVIIITLKK